MSGKELMRYHYVLVKKLIDFFVVSLSSGRCYVNKKIERITDDGI